MNISEEHLHDDTDIAALRRSTYDDVTSIDYVHDPLSYAEFFRRYLLPNRACILGTWATGMWRSRKDWVTDDNRPNLDFMLQKFGEVSCPVANCNLEEYQSHPKQEMTFAEYVKYLREQVTPRETAAATSEDATRSEVTDGPKLDSPCSDKTTECLYLKDWHFTREFPDYEAYRCPMYFSSDWLNEFWDCQKQGVDDYRFVYIGPKGSWTPFHSDVLRSYSWSANIVGCKKWIFFPPGEDEFLKDKFGHLVFDLRSPDLEDASKFPNAGRVRKKFEVIQRSGEVIFVPSGWHHQVFNMEDTISINHNWLNGCNIDLCWQHVVTGLHDVEREIEDCLGMDGWTEQCQLLLKANLGTDFSEFYQFLLTIAQRRMAFLDKCDLDLKPNDAAPAIEIYINDSTEETVSESMTFPVSAKSVQKHHKNENPVAYYSELTRNHAVFDLRRVKAVVMEMLANVTFSALKHEAVIRPSDLLVQVSSYVEKYAS